MIEKPNIPDESGNLSLKTIDNINDLSSYITVEKTINLLRDSQDLISSLSTPSDLPRLDLGLFENMYPDIENSFKILFQRGTDFLKKYEKSIITREISDEARDIYNQTDELIRSCIGLIRASDKINLNIFSDEKKDILHDSGVSYTTLEKINYSDSEDPLETHRNLSNDDKEKIKSAFFDNKTKKPTDTHSNFELAVYFFKDKIFKQFDKIEETKQKIKNIADEFPEIRDGIITGDKILRSRK